MLLDLDWTTFGIWLQDNQEMAFGSLGRWGKSKCLMVCPIFVDEAAFAEENWQGLDVLCSWEIFRSWERVCLVPFLKFAAMFLPFAKFLCCFLVWDGALTLLVSVCKFTVAWKQNGVSNSVPRWLPLCSPFSFAIMGTKSSEELKEGWKIRKNTRIFLSFFFFLSLSVSLSLWMVSHHWETIFSSLYSLGHSWGGQAQLEISVMQLVTEILFFQQCPDKAPMQTKDASVKLSRRLCVRHVDPWPIHVHVLSHDTASCCWQVNRVLHIR